MLVLSRKPQETIVIGEGDDQIVITVIRTKGKTVRIGIEANENIPVLRGELRFDANPDPGDQRKEAA